MTLVERAKNICLSPNTEWPVIADEHTSSGALFSGYVVPLAAIGVVAGFIGGSIIGRPVPFLGMVRTPIFLGLVAGIVTLVLSLIGVFVIALIINVLAPTFGGQQDMSQALKVAVYSYTPAWIAGALRILPLLGLLALLAAFYGLYLLYLGLPRLMKCPKDRAVAYTAVVVVCAIFIGIVIAGTGALFAGAAALGTSAVASAVGTSGSRSSAPAATVEYDKNSPMGRLQEIGRKLEASNKKMEAAEKSGDTAGQTAAAFEGIGTLLGGGRRFDPVSIDELKPLVPDSFAGLKKTSSNVEKSGIAGLMVSKAEATYTDGADKHVTLEMSDTGGMSGLVALAGWASIQGEREDDNASERTAKVNGRLVHEKRSKVGGTNEYGVVVGDRFVVNASGRGVSLNDLQSAVGGLDLAKLESMKDQGAQK